MSKFDEKDLDKIINEKFKNSPKFSEWFLSKTKFSGEFAGYYWSRCDHPWYRRKYTEINSETGKVEQKAKDSETDILVVFETEHKKRFALHIENKLTSKFEHLQPEQYPIRAKDWAENPKYRNYTDWETVLIAPIAFYEKYITDSKKFDRYISHEDISLHIHEFKSSLKNTK